MTAYMIANYRLRSISHWLNCALEWENAFWAKMVGDYAYKTNADYCVLRAADNCLCRMSLEAIEQIEGGDIIMPAKDDYDFVVELADVEVAKFDPEAKAAGNERTLHEIAKDIRDNWPNVNYAAKPYLDAMSQMRSIDDMYGLEEGVFVVLYFLSNASGWRGEAAKRIKAELNAQVKAHNARKGW